VWFDGGFDEKLGLFDELKCAIFGKKGKMEDWNGGRLEWWNFRRMNFQ
jgi:hypothetical protein